MAKFCFLLLVFCQLSETAAEVFGRLLLVPAFVNRDSPPFPFSLLSDFFIFLSESSHHVSVWSSPVVCASAVAFSVVATF